MNKNDKGETWSDFHVDVTTVMEWGFEPEKNYRTRENLERLADPPKRQVQVRWISIISRLNSRNTTKGPLFLNPPEKEKTKKM